MGEKYAAKDNTIQPFRLCLHIIFLSCLYINKTFAAHLAKVLSYIKAISGVKDEQN